MEIGAFYQHKLNYYLAELNLVSEKLKRIVWYRLFSFVLLIVPWFFIHEIWICSLISAGFLILFLFLVKKNIALEKRKKKLSVLKKIAEDETEALTHSFSTFYNGQEFIDANHNFSYDLDLFGEGSLFQFLNRTSTPGGREKLAGWLKNPFVEKQEITKRQHAIYELAQIPNWRLQFLARGNLSSETKELNNEIKSWAGMELPFKHSGRTKWLIRLVPAFTLISIIPAVVGFSNLLLFSFVFFQWLLLYFYWNKITLYFKFFGRKSELLGKYMHLLKFIEEREFQATFLTELQKKVKRPYSASQVFKQLKSLVKEFEYRQNMLVGFILNSFLMWDIRCIYKLWKWHGQNHKKLTDWLDVIAETDALVSIGNYANNNPEYAYPEIHEGGFTFQAENLAHPLLHPEKRISNNFMVNGWSKVLIVTGANMAGKSTFLRTVGVNLILSRLGAPICASTMRTTPIEIYTNMRTTDSLLKEESYFFAELKRIKGVLDRLKNNERIFVVLDEMLKGTNSIDKLDGSKKLIRKLLELKAVALIATHDLKLSEMQDEFPQQVINKCFEIRTENNELVFDYKLSEGVTKTMNATFLLKKMGIID